MEQPCKVHANTASAATRLKKLGIPMPALQEAVRWALAQASACTDNDVPMAKGMTAWMKTVRGLRDQLCPIGFQGDDSGNFSTVVDPTNSFAIAVAAGNDFTGREDKTPSTLTERGPMTRAAVETNRQLHLGDISEAFKKYKPLPPHEALETWYLLYFEDVQADEIRIELSLPNHMAGDHIVSWLERIIVTPQAGADGLAVSTANDGDDNDDGDLKIEVTKREAS
jgi:hypothetical protein